MQNNCKSRPVNSLFLLEDPQGKNANERAEEICKKGESSLVFRCPRYSMFAASPLTNVVLRSSPRIFKQKREC